MKAVLVGFDFETEKIMYQAFEGETSIDDCHSFKESIASDFPEMTFGVVADEEACEARVALYLGSNTTTRVPDVLPCGHPRSSLVRLRFGELPYCEDCKRQNAGKA